MATALASSIKIEATLIPSSHQKQVACRFSGLKAVSFNPQKRAFPALRLASCASSASRVFCAANPKTLKRVCDVVNKQLALSGDASVTPESDFSALGADSLDKMEIVMALEEEFKIILGEEGSGTITTVQEAVDMIDSHLQNVV